MEFFSVYILECKDDFFWYCCMNNIPANVSLCKTTRSSDLLGIKIYIYETGWILRKILCVFVDVNIES